MRTVYTSNPVFDRLQYANMVGEGLGDWLHQVERYVTELVELLHTDFTIPNLL